MDPRIRTRRFATIIVSLGVATPALAINDPVVGRWLTRDPLYYDRVSLLLPTNGLRSAVAVGDDRGQLLRQRLRTSQHRLRKNEGQGLLRQSGVHTLAQELQLTRQYGDGDPILRRIGQIDVAFGETKSVYEMAESNTNVFSDPLGTCVKWYGNWCGPMYCGGVCLCPPDVPPPDGFKCSCECGNAPPTNEFDGCCKDHDECYDSFGNGDAVCDAVMCECMLSNGQPNDLSDIKYGIMVFLFCGFWP